MPSIFTYVGEKALVAANETTGIQRMGKLHVLLCTIKWRGGKRRIFTHNGKKRSRFLFSSAEEPDQELGIPG
jgi:hypothetical protein